MIKKNSRRYIPSEKDLYIAWGLKLKKKTVQEISDKLGISKGVYEKNRPEFNSFFKQQARKMKSKRNGGLYHRAVKSEKKSEKGFGPSYKNGERKLNPEDIDLDVLRSYVICGFNREKIAGLLGISRGTLVTLGKIEPAIQHVLDSAKQEAAASILQNGLLKLCTHRTIKDKYFSSYQGEIVSEEYDKNVEPNLGAIKYLFANTIGWQSEAKPTVTNNKGTILSMMDEIANHDDDVGPGKNIEDLESPQNKADT